MCKCNNIEIGSYKRQTSMKDPFNFRNRHNGWICIDTCLVQEIVELWYLGIKTIECCCGHNKNKGYIMTLKSDYKKMIDLGYKEDIGYNNDEFSCFIPLINKRR